ncbi:MAG TPA: WD40 repeat domain-containing protein, partial [Thermoanaerobaculia bacterium]
PDRLLSDVRATTDLLEERSANGIDESAALLRASVLAGILETEQERLHASPEALSSLVHNRLVERESSPGASAFRYRGGQPPELRLHRVVRRSTGDGGEPAVRGHRGPVGGVLWLSAGRSGLLSWGEDGVVLVWALPSTAPQRLTARPGVAVGACAVLPSEEVAVAYADGVVEILHPFESSEPRAIQAHEQPIGGIVAMGSDDGRFATFAADGLVRLWQPEDDTPLLTLHGGHSGPVAAAVLLPGDRLATGAADGSVRIWDLGTGEEMHRLKAHNAPATVLAFGEGPYLATAGEDATVRLWNHKSLELVAELHGHDLAVTAVEFDPAGNVVSASLDRTVRRWSSRSGKQMDRFDHPAVVTGMAIPVPDETVWAHAGEPLPLVTACADGTLRALVPWSAAWRRESVLDAHRLPCRGCAIDPAASTLVSWSDDGSIALWDLKTAELLFRLAEPEPPRRPLIARDRSWIAFGPQGGFEAHLDREELRELRGPVNAAEMNVVVDRTESRVAFWYEEAGTARDRILALHPPEGGVRRLPTSHTRRIGGCAAISDDRVLTWSWDGTLQIHSLQGSALASVLRGHRGPILECRVSRGERPRALSASTDASVRLWDLETGSLLRVWEEVSPHVTALLIDEDLERYPVGTAAGEVVVLLPEWPKVVPLSGHQGAVRGLAIQPDALSEVGFPRFYSTGDDGTLRLWNLLDPYEIEAAAVAYADAPLRSVSAIGSYVAAQDVWGNLWIYHHVPNDAR